MSDFSVDPLAYSYESLNCIQYEPISPNNRIENSNQHYWSKLIDSWIPIKIDKYCDFKTVLKHDIQKRKNNNIYFIQHIYKSEKFKIENILKTSCVITTEQLCVIIDLLLNMAKNDINNFEFRVPIQKIVKDVCYDGDYLYFVFANKKELRDYIKMLKRIKNAKTITRTTVKLRF